MAIWDRLSTLPVTIERAELRGLEREYPEFLRLTTVVELHGLDQTGVGEDPGYDPSDHLRFQSAGPPEIAGEFTLASLAELLDNLDLFPEPPTYAASRNYRRWAVESAALDLALRQARIALAELVGRPPRPTRFVNSLGLGDPPSLDPLRRRLETYPGMRFKLDARSAWTDEFVGELAALAPVDVIDLKGKYEGTPVDQPADASLYRRIAEAFPDAWLEDPALTPETEEALAGHEERISWDEPIHSIAEIESFERRPGAINIKPVRFNSLKDLFDTYEWCEAEGIPTYGGGSFELGPGREHIQRLAGLFSPDAPNDVAPGGYNEPDPDPGLPTSPLPVVPAVGL